MTATQTSFSRGSVTASSHRSKVIATREEIAGAALLELAKMAGYRVSIDASHAASAARVTNEEGVMDIVEGMRMFVRVAELKSFRSAAKELGVSNPSATRTITALEARLNIQLMDRTTRSVRLTASGLNYLASCHTWLENLEQLEAAVGHAEVEPRGALRISASSALPLPSLTALIDGFRRRYANVDVRLTVLARDEDCLGTGYDVSVVANVDVDDKELTTYALWKSPLICVATAAYLELRGTPRLPVELKELPYIGLSSETVDACLVFVSSDGQREQVVLTPVYSVNSPAAVEAAMLANMGFSVVPASSVAAGIRHGTLQRLVPTYSIDEPATAAVLCYSRIQPTSAARAFIDYARTDVAADVMLTSSNDEQASDRTLRARRVGGDSPPISASAI